MVVRGLEDLTSRFVAFWRDVLTCSACAAISR